MEFTFLDQNTPTSPNSSSTFSTTIPIVVSPPTSSSNPSKHSSKTIPTAKPSTSTTKPSTSTPKLQPSTSKSYAEAVRAMGSKTDKAHSIRITGEQNPLSNLYKYKLNSQGAVWHSVEHLYQYQRAIFLDQGELSDQIISATNAHQVLQIAKNLPYSPLWDKHQLSFMDTLLELKYEQCDEFRVKLHQSGSSKLELKVPDMFWGTGNRGNGESHFGKLLQNLRSKIKKKTWFSHPRLPSFLS